MEVVLIIPGDRENGEPRTIDSYKGALVLGKSLFRSISAEKKKLIGICISEKSLETVNYMQGFPKPSLIEEYIAKMEISTLEYFLVSQENLINAVITALQVFKTLEERFKILKTGKSKYNSSGEQILHLDSWEKIEYENSKFAIEKIHIVAPRQLALLIDDLMSYMGCKDLYKCIYHTLETPDAHFYGTESHRENRDVFQTQMLNLQENLIYKILPTMGRYNPWEPL